MAVGRVLGWHWGDQDTDTLDSDGHGGQKGIKMGIEDHDGNS